MELELIKRDCSYKSLYGSYLIFWIKREVEISWIRKVDGVKKLNISGFWFCPQGFRFAAPWAGLHKRSRSPVRREWKTLRTEKKVIGLKDPFNQNQLYYTLLLSKIWDRNDFVNNPFKIFTLFLQIGKRSKGHIKVCLYQHASKYQPFLKVWKRVIIRVVWFYAQ